MTRGPTIVRVQPGGGGGGRGIKCCCCRCCECLNLGYLASHHGIIKLAEAMLGGLCQSLLVKYGMSEASSMGSAFHGFLTTASACLLTTALLITCYVLSSNTQQLIRQSIFECLFNAVACFLYLSASSYMGVAVNIYLYPRYVLVNMYAAYPAMTAVYYIGVVVGILHGVDAYLSYKYHEQEAFWTHNHSNLSSKLKVNEDLAAPHAPQSSHSNSLYEVLCNLAHPPASQSPQSLSP